ncbi:MAG: hypothetical protein JXB47_05850 [Anaerolineae bacterium]|nr:hypothetical protein [Anaerolineae bacterium]
MQTSILLIDPNIQFAARVQKALEKNGAYQVSVFATTQAALEQSERQRYVVAVVDFDVEDAAGLAARLREAQPGLRIIAVHDPDTPLPPEVEIDGDLHRPYRARDLVALLLHGKRQRPARKPSGAEEAEPAPTAEAPAAPARKGLTFDDLFESGVGLQEKPDAAPNAGQFPTRRGSPTRKFGTDELAEREPSEDAEGAPEGKSAERGQRPLYEIVMGDAAPSPSGDEPDSLEGVISDEPVFDALPDDLAPLQEVMAQIEAKSTLSAEDEVVDLEDTDEMPDWLAEEKALVDELIGQAEPAGVEEAEAEAPPEPDREPSLLAGGDLPDWLAAELPNVPSTDELRAPPGLEEKAGDEAESDASEPDGAPIDESVARVALQLTHLAAHSPAEIMLVTLRRQLVGYTGPIQEADALDLAAAVYRHWDPQGASSQTQAQFVRLQSTAKDYILYSAPTAGAMVLSMAFPANMPLRQVRRQAREIERALQRAEWVMDVAEVEEEEIAPVEGEAGAGVEAAAEAGGEAEAATEDLPETAELTPPPSPDAPVDAAQMTSYAFAWALRDVEWELDDGQRQHMERWLAEIAGLHGWRVQAAETLSGCVSLQVEVPTTNLPAQVVELMMDALSNRMLAAYADEFTPPPGRGIWADGYYVVSPARALTEREVRRFIDFQRRERSTSRSN